MDRPSTSTALPPVRRARRTDWVRLVCRILCVVLAVAGTIPLGLGVLVRTRWAQGLATRETTKIAARYGVQATYAVDLRLWPLSVALRNIRVEASDGGAPFLVARALVVRPKLFALLSGKLAIDQIELLAPRARVVLRDGKLANLALNLPESGPKQEDTGPKRPPFDVVSVSGLDLDVTVDDKHFVGTEIDADVTTDDDGDGGAAYELALRVEEAHGTLSHLLSPDPEHPAAPARAIDDDTLCGLDARARFVPGKRVLVRRLSLHGAADMDPAPGTALRCDLARSDYRFVEVALGHLAVSLPQKAGDLPNVQGHLKARAPLPLLARTGAGPYTEGWVGVDLELRYSPETPIPDVTGRFESHDLRVARFNFAKHLHGELAIERGVVSVPVITLDIAGSETAIRDVEVRPLAPGVPIKVGKVDVANADFTKLLRDFHVHPRPFVGWDVREIHVRDVAGTAVPLKLDGDVFGKTYDFVVNDRSAIDPARHRVIGVREAALDGKLAIRPKEFLFQHMTVTTPRSIARDATIGIGYHEELFVDVPSATVDIEDVAPLGSVPMSGVVDAKVTITGTAGDPVLVGEVGGIKDFVIGDIPFGNVTGGHVRADIGKVTVDIADVHGQKGKSTYEMPTGRLDFGAPADMRLDGQIVTKNLDVRDFFAMFHLDDDPRFTEIGGILEAQARMHIVLGGPEDRCGGGFLTVAATTTGHDLNLLGEKFDEAHADFEYRWFDRLAGIEGAEVDVRSISLAKVKKPGRPAIGTVLGALSLARGGELRGDLVAQGYPLARIDLLGPAAKNLEGAASAVVRVGGKVTAFDIAADVDVTPMRIAGAPFGGSDLHLAMTQIAKPERPVGRTACGAPIGAPFDKAAFLKDTSSQGEYRVDGRLFGGQVRLDDVVATRQAAPVLTGKVGFDRFDLGPLGKILAARSEGEAVPLGGEVSGELTLERVAMNDLGHARAQFVSKTVRVVRGGQKIELRDPAAVFKLANDVLVVPKVAFELVAQNGLAGAVSLAGNVTRVTHGGRLDLDAELTPIDLGILVGVVPKITRAAGTLKGSVHVTGDPGAPTFDGKLTVRGGELGIAGLPGGVTDLEVDAEADANELRIARGVGRFLGGEVNVTAQMPIKGGQIGIGRATVTGRQLSLTPVDGVRVTADADLEVTLNTTASTAQGRLPFVGGTIDLTQFEYTRPVTVDLTGFRGGRKRTVVDAYDPTADSLAFGVDLRARVPLVIKNNLVDAKLGIDPHGIRVTGTNQRVGLRGELVTLPGGRFRVFANDFELQKGYIRFDDPTRIVPNVDITGVTEYRRYTSTVSSGDSITSGSGAGSSVTNYNVSSGGRGGGLWRISLHAFGDTEDLHVDMTSDPVLSREDIFFLLTIGLTRAEVDQVRAGSVYASAAFEAIGTVSGADRAVKQAIPIIDDFRFGSAYSPRTGRTEPQVTIGRRLTDNVRANVSTGLTEDRQLRSIVEWRLSRPLRVEASYDNISTVSSGSVGNFGLDFRWRLEFE